MASKKVFDIESNHNFDSKFEYVVHSYIKSIAVELGIQSIKLQPKIRLLPKFTTKLGRNVRERVYTPDFALTLKSGKILYVEAKGFARDDFRLRESLFLYLLTVDSSCENDFYFRCDQLGITKNRWNVIKKDVRFNSRSKYCEYVWQKSLYLTIQLMNDDYKKNITKKVDKLIKKDVYF